MKYYFRTFCALICAVAMIVGPASLNAESKEIGHAKNGLKATTMLIAYFETLVSKNILTVENLKFLCHQDTLINPISEEEARSSDEVFTHRKQINQLIEKNQKDLFDVKEIQKWANGKVLELEEHTGVKAEVYAETSDIHKPMTFIAIPPGSYTSNLDGNQFEIAEGIEIQQTPMTQWQLAGLVKTNPSLFVEGLVSEEREINGTKIKMLADYPVENLSYEQAETFIKYINEFDNEYYYRLPSLHEFEAILQSALGNGWLRQLSLLNSCNDLEKTCAVGQGCYLTVSGKRMCDVVGNVWQMTRDNAVMHESGHEKGIWQKLAAIRKFFSTHEKSCTKYDGNRIKAHLVFGSSYNTHKDSLIDMKALTRPVFCKQSSSSGIGFRLVRCKKNDQSKFIRKDHVITWDEKYAAADNHWDMDKDTAHKTIALTDDIVSLMVENPEHYPSEAGLACAKIMDKSSCHDVNCVRSIHYLSQMDEQIHDVWLISYLKNLETLYLSGNHISDISPLSRLVNLRHLGLADNKITDIQPLARLTHLQDLSLGYDSIKNLSPLAHLTNLQSLSLNGIGIDDIAPLENFVNLKKLSLAQNPIKDFVPLSKLTGLSSLSVDNSTLSNLESIKFLTGLTHLHLSNNSIHDISPLKNLVHMERLKLGNNAIKDLAPLTQMSYLWELSLENNQIHDVEPLSSIVHLRELNLAGNKVTNISPLANLTNLYRLDLSNNTVEDIVPLKNLQPLLIDLNLANNFIRDITPLSTMTSLIDLTLDNNLINDISPLSELADLLLPIYTTTTVLNRLSLRGNQISDVSHLKNFKVLDSLSLDNNLIIDISPLASLETLRFIGLSGNPISDLLSLKEIKGLENLHLDKDQIEKLKPHRILPYVKIIDVTGGNDKNE